MPGKENGKLQFKLFVLCAALASLHCAAAWTSISFSPYGRYGMGFATGGGKIYIFAGFDDLYKPSGNGEYYNDLHEFDIATATWTDLSTPTSGTPPSLRQNMGIAIEGDKIYVFGGSNAGGNLNDLHVFDIPSRTWTDLSTPLSGTVPGIRSQLGFASSMGKLYVFSGTGAGNDLHSYDIATATWTDLSTPTAGNPPSSRAGPMAASQGKLYIFSGTGAQDLHSYDIATATWTDISTPTAGNVPPARRSMGFTAYNNKLYVWAGVASASLNDLHEYAIDTATWTDLSTPAAGTIPGPRHSPGLAASMGKLFMFGGWINPGTTPRAEYDLASAEWKDDSPFTLASPRARHSLGFATAPGKHFVFGGDGGGVYLNDLHMFDVSKKLWHELSAQGDANAPPARVDMGFSAIGDKVYVFGGHSQAGGGLMNDLWEFDIPTATWTEISVFSGTPPSTRNNMGMVGAAGKLWIFGGDEGAPGLHNDLTVFDPLTATYTDLSTPTSGTPPGARYRMGFTAKEDGGMLYVFGGYQQNGLQQNDLHAYDIAAASWTDLSGGQGPKPAPRNSMQIAEVNGKLYVLGGAIASTPQSDFYVYDFMTTNWTDSTTTIGAPPRRSAFGMGSSEGSLYVFGGLDGNTVYRDMWSLLVVPPYVRCAPGNKVKPNRAFEGCMTPPRWEELAKSHTEDTLRAGGLGCLTEHGKHEVWMCLRDDPCAATLLNDAGMPDPWFCYVWDELRKQFSIWDWHSNLKLFHLDPPQGTPPPSP